MHAKVEMNKLNLQLKTYLKITHFEFGVLVIDRAFSVDDKVVSNR